MASPSTHEPWELPEGVTPAGRWRVEVHGSSVVVSDGRTQQYRASTGAGGHVGPVLQVYYQSSATPTHWYGQPVTYGEPRWEPRAYGRLAFGEDLARVLDGEKVESLGGFEAVGPRSFAHRDGRHVTVDGPYVDADPPNCRWVEDDRLPARYLRDAIRDRLAAVLLA